GQLSYRFSDFEKAASALDFTVNLKTQAPVDNPLPTASKRIINLAEVQVKSRIKAMTLNEALSASRQLAEEVLVALQGAAQLQQMGIEVTGFTVLKIAAANDTTRALEAGTREQILQQADDALYVRRNAAIEQERHIKENELQTESTVVERKRVIQENELQTRRMVIEQENELKRMDATGELERERLKLDEEAAMEKIRVGSELERKHMVLDGEIALEEKRRTLAELRLENAKKDADAEAYRIRSVMEAYNTLSADVLIALATMDMDPNKLIARAFEKLADGSKIGTLNITPDLLESLGRRAD
ncbi:MAG: hypothetical protein IIY70_04270, partial [Oscillospiraceae bacterium]|nr:hypothetical protein [Oscillospiraceae bacterium]